MSHHPAGFLRLFRWLEKIAKSSKRQVCWKAVFHGLFGYIELLLSNLWSDFLLQMPNNYCLNGIYFGFCLFLWQYPNLSCLLWLCWGKCCNNQHLKRIYKMKFIFPLHHHHSLSRANGTGGKDLCSKLYFRDKNIPSGPVLKYLGFWNCIICIIRLTARKTKSMQKAHTLLTKSNWRGHIIFYSYSPDIMSSQVHGPK